MWTIARGGREFEIKSRAPQDNLKDRTFAEAPSTKCWNLRRIRKYFRPVEPIEPIIRNIKSLTNYDVDPKKVLRTCFQRKIGQTFSKDVNKIYPFEELRNMLKRLLSELKRLRNDSMVLRNASSTIERISEKIDKLLKEKSFQQERVFAWLNKKPLKNLGEELLKVYDFCKDKTNEIDAPYSLDSCLRLFYKVMVSNLPKQKEAQKEA